MVMQQICLMPQAEKLSEILEFNSSVTIAIKITGGGGGSIIIIIS